MKLLTGTCIAVLAFAWAIGPAEGETIAQYTSATSQRLYMDKDITTAQAFVPIGDHTATEIQVQLSRSRGTAGKVMVELRDETAGHPSASALDHEEVSFDKVPMAAGAWMSFKLGTAVPLTGGHRYWVMVKVTPGSDINVDWYSKPWNDPPLIPDYGAGDDVQSSTDGGTTWTILQGQDTNFKVFGARAALPTTTTVTLDPISVTTNGPTTATVTVRDSSNNLVQGPGTVTLSVTKGTLGSATLTLSNGQAHTTWTATASTTGYSATATYGGHSYAGNDYAGSTSAPAILTVVAQNLTTTTAEALSTYNALAHNPITVSVTVKDQNQAVFTGGKIAFTCPQGGSFGSSSVSVVNGLASTTWDPPYSEVNCSITASFSGYNDIGAGKRYGQSSDTKVASVTFPVVPTNTTITVSPDYPYKLGKAWATILVKDNLGKPVPGGTVSLITDWGYFDSTTVPLAGGKGTMVWHAPASAQNANPVATYQSGAPYKSGGYAYAMSGSTCVIHTNEDPDMSIISTLIEWNTNYTNSPLTNTGLDADGFRDKLNAVGWDTSHEYFNTTSRQKDYKLSSQSGEEDSYADANDYAYYSGHGNPHHITFITSKDDTKLTDEQAYYAWGDKDAEWLSFSACLVMSNPGEWANTMNGVHLECGFHTTMSDSSTFGGIYGDLLTQTDANDVPQQICQAWFLASDKSLSCKHKQVVIAESWDMFSDYIWGQGYVNPDPVVDTYYSSQSHDAASTMPIANAGGGPTKTYNAVAESPVQLDGSGSSDPDPTQSIWYNWDTNTGLNTDSDDWDDDGIDGATDDRNATGVRPWVIFNTAGSYTVRLMVHDPFWNVATDVATVVVAPKPGPAPKPSDLSKSQSSPDDVEIVDRFSSLPPETAMPTFAVTGGSIGFTQMSSIAYYWGMQGSASVGAYGDWTMTDASRQLVVNSHTSAITYLNRMEAYRWTHEPSYLPEDYYCRGLADAFLTANGMSTSDAMVESITEISQNAGSKGGRHYDSRIPFQKRVNYRRIFNVGQGYPSVGPGGKMIVLLDDSSDVQMFMRIWRPAMKETDQVLNDAASSIADFHTLGTKALIGDSRMPPCNRINIDNVSIGYYEDDFVTPQAKILPVYVLDVTCEDDMGTFGTQVYLPALTAPLTVEATITDPPDSNEVDYGQDVTFDCDVTGGKAPYTYQWSSDRDGVLGAAKTITTNALRVNQRDLEPTMHVVTVTVTDADGWKSSSQVQVLVKPKSVSEAKLLTNGDPLALLGQVVTVSQSDYFYVENSERTTGIKVISDAQPGINGAVAVYGTAGTIHNERCVNATSAQVVKSADAIKPLGTCIRSIGGVASGIPPQGQTGVTGGTGLNTIGLLMRTAGKVTEQFPGESPKRFILDDGSPYKLTCLCLSGVTLPSVDDFCIVTGVSSIGFAPAWNLSASMIVSDCRKVN
ncbi:MAG: DUF6345 domain-containing protein [Armatimonadetes bacterium]|nr:DUF6345 domain-containing protein [Armatimonadota bacterium]